MARNVMNLESIKNKAHRSAFDLSCKRAFTAKAGELLPCYVKEVLPGDRFDINVGHFTRTAPLNSAAFCRIREDVDFYFVPYRLLWDKFPQWVTKTSNPMYAANATAAADVDNTCPYYSLSSYINYYKGISSTTALYDVNYKEEFVKLSELLGFGNLIQLQETGVLPETLPTNSQSINIWRYAAYQKIYQDFYRFNQWESSKPQNYNFDYILNGSFALDFSRQPSTDNIFTLRFNNYAKDYFTGILPRAQFGDTAIAGPILGNGAFNFAVPPLTPLNFSSIAGSGVGHYFLGGTSPGGELHAYSSGSTDLTPVTSDLVWKTFVSSPTGSSISIPASAQSGISVLAIRQAQVLQKYREIILSGNYDYRTQLEKHWNVKTQTSQSDMCYRLGGYNSNLEINEVVNSNLSTSTDFADIKGKGVSRNAGTIHFDNEKFGNDYGVIIGIYSSSPLLDYDCNSCFDRVNTIVDSGSYPISEFDSIGMEVGYRFEYNSASLPLPNNVLGLNVSPVGYVPRYASWKTDRDYTYGGFNVSGSYANWVSRVSLSELTSMFFVGGVLSYQSFKIRPSILNSIFYPQVHGNNHYQYGSRFVEDQFAVNLFVENHAVRNLSENGLPY